jgi:hypothetical protein
MTDPSPVGALGSHEEKTATRVDKGTLCAGTGSTALNASVFREYDGICDGCAQGCSECLCDIDLAEVLNCDSPYHPGCRKCEARGAVTGLRHLRRGW